MPKYTRILVLILALTFVYQITCRKWSEVSRDYLKAYFGVIKGEDFTLNDDCLAGKFDSYIESLNKAILNGDIFQVIDTIEVLYNLELEKCPFEEYSSILKDIKTAASNGTFIKNVMRNYPLIKDKMDKYANSDKSACALGTCVGEITKIVTYGMSYSSWKDPHEEKHLNFLS